MLFPGIFVNEIGEDCRIINKKTIQDTLEGKNIIGQRLTSYHHINQIQNAADYLLERTKIGDRTNKVILTPRDPILDRDREITDLLMIQLRYQLGHLHAAAVFVNSVMSDFLQHISYVYGIQKYVAEKIGSPTGSIFMQYAPLLNYSPVSTD
jgi:hypothetical protein